MPSTTSATRRAQRREATLDEIRDTARSLLEEAGPDAVTLRGIATRLGMAAAGVHYYYASRDDLLTALIIDAFDELAVAAAGAAGLRGRHRPTQAWTATALSYRAWAMAHPELFQLAHSATATRLKGRPGLLEAKNRTVRALVDPLVAAVDRGELDVASGAPPVSRTLGGQLRRYADAAATPDDPQLQLFLLQAYTLVHGAVTLAVTGSLSHELLEDDSLFRAQLARLLVETPASS